MVIVLRAQGPHLDLDACLRWLPAECIDTVWRRGDVRRRGRVVADDGFNVTLADCEEKANAMAEAVQWLETHAPRLTALTQAGNSVHIDIGLFVVSPLPQSLLLDATFLQAIVSLGMTLEVSAYPCSDDED